MGTIRGVSAAKDLRVLFGIQVIRIIQLRIRHPRYSEISERIEEMSALDAAIWPAIILLGYVVAPAMLIWGWMRFCQQPKQKTVISYLSLTGFVLATASAIIGLCSIPFASLVGDLLLRRAIQLGATLSLAGVLISLSGIWRKSPTRWQAPASAIGTLAFWFMTAFWVVYG